MPANNRRLKVHPHLARVAGVAPPPGMSWQIGHYIFVPCEDQVHGDGNPDLESVALLPAEATVSGPWPVGTTRGGGAEVWNGSAWVPNPAYRRPLVVGATRGGGAEVWTGSAWVSNPAFQGAGGALAVGATRGGGAQVWTGSAWVPNPAYQGQPMPASMALQLAGIIGGGQQPQTGGQWDLSASDLVALGAAAGASDQGGGDGNLLAALANGGDGGDGGDLLSVLASAGAGGGDGGDGDGDY